MVTDVERGLQLPVRLQYRPYTLDPAFPVFAFSGQNRPIASFRPLVEDGDGSRYMHLHNCVEITCVSCPAARLHVEKETYALRRGDVVVIMPFTAHFIHEEPGGEPCGYLYFDPQQLLTAFSPGLLTRFPEYAERRCSCLIIPAEERSAAGDYVMQILRELTERRAEHRACVSGLLIALMAETARFGNAQPENVQRPAGSVLSIMPAVQHINDCYMQPIGLGTLQSLCHLSGTQLRRVFHAVMGCAPLAYIQQVRIGHACEQLLSTQKSLTEIASAVGFDSVSSFHRQFVRYHGEAPSRWRKLHAGENLTRLPERPYDARS